MPVFKCVREEGECETFQIKQSITDRSTDSVRMYLKDISKYPLLTPEQERELAVKAFNGDKQAKGIN